MQHPREEWATPTDPQPYPCPHCGAVLGTCLGNVLIIGAVRLWEPVTMECGGCRMACTWQPGEILASRTSRTLPEKG